MNDKVLKMLQNKAEFYPAQLEQQFPRLFEKIFLVWSSPQFDAHLNQLMLDKREQPRKGFPNAVASEILRLSMLHTELFGTSASNSWVDASDVRIE